MKGIENKKFMLVWIVIFLIFVFGIITSINENKSISECKKIIEEIERENFKGIMIEKSRPSHFNRMIINSNIGTIKVYGTYPNLEYKSNIGDSIVKLKNTNIVKIKHKNDSIWVKYKYKTIPYSCEKYSSRFGVENDGNGTD